MRKQEYSALSRVLDTIESTLDFPWSIPPLKCMAVRRRSVCVRERVGRREIDRKMPGNRRRKQEEDAVGGMEEEKDNPMRAR